MISNWKYQGPRVVLDLVGGECDAFIFYKKVNYLFATDRTPDKQDVHCSPCWYWRRWSLQRLINLDTYFNYQTVIFTAPPGGLLFVPLVFEMTCSWQESVNHPLPLSFTCIESNASTKNSDLVTYFGLGELLFLNYRSSWNKCSPSEETSRLFSFSCRPGRIFWITMTRSI